MLKRSYQMLLITMSTLLVAINFLFPFTKVSAEVIQHEQYKMDWSYSHQYGKDVRTELLKNSNGQIAYCLTYGLRSPNGEDLPEVGRADNVVYRILMNGYPQKSPQELGVSNWKEAHYATQLAVWNALGQLSISELEHRNANVEKAAKEIIYAVNHSNATQETYMNVIQTDKQEAKLNGEYFETSLYQVESNAKNGVFTVNLKNAPNGTKIVAENGEMKEQFQLGEKFRILVPKSSNTGNLSLKITSNLVNLHAVAYKGTDKIQDATVLLERSEEKVSTDLNVSWKSVGQLEVIKVGEQKEVLQDAVFDVFNSKNEKVGTITTNEKGIASLSGLEIGTYTLKEVKSPTGYVLNGQPQQIEVKTGEVATITVQNTKVKGNIEIKKSSDSGKTLPKVEFTVYTAEGKEITKTITNEQGIAQVKDLPYGKYYFVETKGVEGYLLNQTKYPFEIKEQGKTLTFTVENKEVKGNVQLLKVDGENPDKKLEGAVFILQDSKGKKISEHKSDKNGLIEVKDLTFGAYSFVEKQAPTGYVLTKESIPFSISEQGKTIMLTAKNKHITGVLEISKVDIADGNNKLPNAEFTIFNEQGKEVAKGKTDENGIAKFKLPYGKYTYKETFAPDGYLLNEEIFPFEIKEDGQIIKHTVKDQKKPTPPTPETPKPEQPEQPQKPEQPEAPQPQVPEQPKVTEKPVIPQLETPQQIIMKPQLEQTPKKIETYLPTTGGKAENPYIKWIGLACVVLGLIGAVFAVRNRKKAQS
ncbi:SpaA isopeptide-forming pilin-related protein [Bacillus thuringiensis]|uniref:SpaA isopeptide-forming pilin-related protein n=1 Tax=Bacillus thuringiensis TaxID=1428 RepID=UPI000BEBECF0|nr:SpaA isopeptide-forming pilin-related protein [Bacillus thuringiensis]MED3526220.1 SpaA isopeptide-forming pilin-related protein [Bacillus thuringiensis]PEE97435.1 adhesin [Bacillus thuringiensis]PEV04498.1 adhesin [Bacillus thuringiensis]PFV47184.1 adhesin [Bacillus thuringiensis]PGW58687.1 adhesin [Bacillus thuringiensis]